METNENVAVSHIISAIRPKTLKNRLQPDLDFAHYGLQKDFRGFMKHAVRLSESFQIVYSAPQSERPTKHQSRPRGGSGDGKHLKPDAGEGRDNGRPRKPRREREAPNCPFGRCKSNGRKHWIRDCPESTDKEKEDMLAEIAASKARDGPRKSTRGQKGTYTATKSSHNTSGGLRVGGTAGCLGRKPKSGAKTRHIPSCNITVSDGNAWLDSQGRCDDGSDDSIVSPALAEKAVIRGIGKITAIKPVYLQVALKDGEEAQKFSFSRSWNALRTVLQLASGQLALANITYLVADSGLACEDLLIGLPVLQHLQVDTKTLLENNRAILNGADYSSVGNPATHLTAVAPSVA